MGIEIDFKPFVVPDSIANKFFTDDSMKIKFSFRHRLYYNFIRRIIPKSMRRKLQNKINYNVPFLQNFIHSEFVESLLSINENKNTLKKIYPSDHDCAIINTHDVEEQEGFNFIPKLLEMDSKYGFKSAINIVPFKYNIDKGIIDLIRQYNCEISIHGYNHDGRLYYSKSIFDKRVDYINIAINEYSASGFRSPMVHRNFEWQQKLNIDYDASSFDYDPFQPFPQGFGTIWPFKVGKFIELPYTLPQDHTLFYVLNVKDISIWKNKVEWLVKNNGMILLLTHPDYLIEKNNMKLYEEFLEYLCTIKNAWRCLPKEMAEHWRTIQNSSTTADTKNVEL